MNKMGTYRFFKIGEEIKNFKGIETVHDYVVEVKKAMYVDEFQKHVNEFGKVITNLKQADEFIIFLGKKGINANYMEYANVML